MMAGQSAFGAVKFQGQQKQSAAVVCAKHLFVAAWWPGFIRACRESANQAVTAGRPGLEPVKCSGAAKAKHHRPYLVPAVHWQSTS
jgi:hypothetical protein